MSLEISVSDLVTCKRYVETLPKPALKKGEQIHKKIQEILYQKYWGEPEFKLQYTYPLDDERSITIKGRVDFIDYQNKRIIEIKPFYTKYYAEIQALMYYEIANLMGYRVEPYLLKYRVRNGKLKIEIARVYPIWGIIRNNIEKIYELAEKIDKGEQPRIKVMTCGNCPYRYNCRPEYIWIRKYNTWILASPRELAMLETL